MRVLEKGHTYALKTREGSEAIVGFVKSLPEGDPTNHDGPLLQEYFRAEIDRLWELQQQKPSKYTHKMIKRIRKNLIDAETRAFKETLKKSYAKCGLHVEQLPTRSNGHVFCLEQGADR